MNRTNWMWMRASVALMAAAAAAMKHVNLANTAVEDMPALAEPIASQ